MLQPFNIQLAKSSVKSMFCTLPESYADFIKSIPAPVVLEARATRMFQNAVLTVSEEAQFIQIKDNLKEWNYLWIYKYFW